jgi:CubicO group peptidase (beta-lactamase class C family)
MWWVVRDHNKYPHLPNVSLKEGTYSARGAGGHYVIMIPDYDMVFVHRVNTYIQGNSVSGADVGRMLQTILDARI